MKTFALFLWLTASAFASDVEIESLLKTHGGKDLPARIESYSEAFLDRPSLDGPLGEGADGKYDRDPLYRTDGFDCTTLVETVMALSLSSDLRGFSERIDRIRYRDGKVGYVTRNHFPDLDWIPNNRAILVDISEEVAGKGKVKIAEAIVSKRGWYAKKKIGDIRRPDLTETQLPEILADFRREGEAFKDAPATIPYVPLTLFFPEGTADPAAFDKIPSGSIVSIVRPNWDLTAGGGTHMNVSHQGLAIRKAGILYYRQATSAAPKKVVDVVLADYLKPYLKSPTIRGINLLRLKQD